MAFNNIFGTPMGIDPADFARRQAQKKSMLDLVIRDHPASCARWCRSRSTRSSTPQLSAIRDLEPKSRRRRLRPGSPIVKPTLKSRAATGHNGANADEAATGAHSQHARDHPLRVRFRTSRASPASPTHRRRNPLRPLAILSGADRLHQQRRRARRFPLRQTAPTRSRPKARCPRSTSALTAEALARMSQNARRRRHPARQRDRHVFTECRDGDYHSRARNPALLFGGKFLKLNAGQLLVVRPRSRT